MPIAVGGNGGVRRVGGPSLVATPGRAAGWSTEGGPPSTLGPGAGCTAPRPKPFSRLIQSSPGVAPFRATPLAPVNRSIAGVTRDSTGAPLGVCDLDLYMTHADMLAAQTQSDAAGAFTFWNPGSGPYYIVAYKTGLPDVAGTTVNTLVAT
jgi:hypothetical protein